jgi:O-antigen ligase
MIGIAVAQGKFGSAYYTYSATSQYLRPHALAQLAVLIMPFVLAQIIAGHRTRLSIIVAGLLGLGILLSLVRTGYLAVAMILAAYAFAGLRTTALRVRLSLVAMSVAVGFALYFFWGTLVKRLADLPLIGSLLGTPPTAQTGSGRVTFWAGLLKAGTDNLQHILIGRGAGASAVLNEQLFGPIGSHNDFIEFFITGGIILLGVYLAFMIWILATMVRLYRDSRQSQTVHLCSVLLIGAFFGYVAMATTDGITLAAGSVVMAAIVGMTQGMLYTPGHTALDAALEPSPPVAEEAATG